MKLSRMNDECFSRLNCILTILDAEDGIALGQINDLYLIMPMDGEDGFDVGRMLHMVNVQCKFRHAVRFTLPVTMFVHGVLLENVIL
ncbi:hypothetical protein D3C78_1860450 [compost metagenome]